MGKTIFFSSHILSEVADICNSVAILEAGKLIAYGDMAEMKRRLRTHRLIQVKFLGDSETLQAALLAERPVESVMLASELDLPPDTLRFDFNGDDGELSGLLGRLIQQGLPIVTFSEETGDLEDLFLQVTQGIVN